MDRPAALALCKRQSKIVASGRDRSAVEKRNSQLLNAPMAVFSAARSEGWGGCEYVILDRDSPSHPHLAGYSYTKSRARSVVPVGSTGTKVPRAAGNRQRTGSFFVTDISLRLTGERNSKRQFTICSSTPGAAFDSVPRTVSLTFQRHTKADWNLPEAREVGQAEAFWATFLCVLVADTDGSIGHHFGAPVPTPITCRW
ncbi:hypothetical protein Enr13x_37610 [Stieleria neptunia]|uniref:Uncharacterized protein n=1 Tax=Stieleria neptunia TaxID=2527979 RepID=A0A518HSY1_9BACT|nr:hypothetical protein Enr13x_37610 [Stieleria neptunia]